MAFFSVADVPAAFNALLRECPAELRGIYDNFKEYYIAGKPNSGRQRATRPRHVPTLWNQFETAVSKSRRTNNVSEDWHNRFQVVIGKHHPDLFTAIIELQKEQGSAEVCITELALAKKFKTAPNRKWTELQHWLEGIAAEYGSIPTLEYLERLGDTINIS